MPEDQDILLLDNALENWRRLIAESEDNTRHGAVLYAYEGMRTSVMALMRELRAIRKLLETKADTPRTGGKASKTIGNDPSNMDVAIGAIADSPLPPSPSVDAIYRAKPLEWATTLSAPYDRDLELAVIDRDGVHALVFPCRRILDGWVDADSRRRVDVRPTHWREWVERRSSPSSSPLEETS